MIRMRARSSASAGARAICVLEPFQDAADRAVELLCGAPEEERTEIPSISSEEQQVS